MFVIRMWGSCGLAQVAARHARSAARARGPRLYRLGASIELERGHRADRGDSLRHRQDVPVAHDDRRDCGTVSPRRSAAALAHGRRGDVLGRLMGAGDGRPDGPVWARRGAADGRAARRDPHGDLRRGVASVPRARRLSCRAHLGVTRSKRVSRLHPRPRPGPPGRPAPPSRCGGDAECHSSSSCRVRCRRPGTRAGPFPCREHLGFADTGTGPLEFLVVGIARDMTKKNDLASPPQRLGGAAVRAAPDAAADAAGSRVWNA